LYRVSGKTRAGIRWALILCVFVGVDTMTTTDFVMPKLGLTMTDGTISRWNLTPGSRFKAGEVVLVVETDKIAYDVEAPAPGILQEVLVSEGSAVPVGTPIGRWDVGDIRVSLDAPVIEPEASDTTPAASEAARIPAKTPPRGERERILATPFARRLAREAGIDLRHVDGSGPKGRITAADVNSVVAAARPEIPPAARLSAADQSPPSVYRAGVEINVTALLKLNEQINSDLTGLRAELVHYIVLAASKISDIFPEPWFIGLAPSREGAGGMVSLFASNDCRTLRSTIVRIENSATPADPSSLCGALWIERALDGISFFSVDPPSGWSASFNIGSVREEFRPDSNGRPIRAAVVSVVLTSRARELDSTSSQRLLRRIRELLESPLLLLTS